jgi:hypothetical protein
MSKYEVDNVYIDGANPSFIKSLKLQIGEDADYDKVIASYRSEKLGDGTKDMRIVPVNFNTEHKAMLGCCPSPSPLLLPLSSAPLPLFSQWPKHLVIFFSASLEFGALLIASLAP